MPKAQPTKAAKYLIDQICGDTGYVVEGHGKAFLDKSRNQTYQAADSAGLRTAVENFSQCIDELESSGYCHDHPSLVKYRKALAALTGEQP